VPETARSVSCQEKMSVVPTRVRHFLLVLCSCATSARSHDRRDTGANTVDYQDLCGGPLTTSNSFTRLNSVGRIKPWWSPHHFTRVFVITASSPAAAHYYYRHSQPLVRRVQIAVGRRHTLIKLSAAVPFCPDRITSTRQMCMSKFHWPVGTVQYSYISTYFELDIVSVRFRFFFAV